MTAHSIPSKLRRAIKNGTGVTFNNSQVREFGELGILEDLMSIEAEELCPRKRHHSSSEISGLTREGTAPHRTYGRSRPTRAEAGPLCTEALSVGL